MSLVFSDISFWC